VNHRERHYRFQWVLQNTPEALWPLVADTNRFNADTGFAAVVTEGIDPDNPAVLRMRLQRLGMTIRWREFPFDWVAPHQFGVVREYLNGPLRSVRMQARLIALPEGGAKLIYEIWTVPRNILSVAMSALQINRSARRKFGEIFRHYDQLAGESSRPRHGEERGMDIPEPVRDDRLAPFGERLAKISGCNRGAIDNLLRLVRRADDFSLIRLRPYAYADLWGESRASTLDLFLHATRAGLLDFRWEVLCPLCRGSKASAAHLSDIPQTVHCDTCQITYGANFDQAVELVFQPNRSVREIRAHDFCVGGPQVTPHIVAQASIAPDGSKMWRLALQEGRYRLRASHVSGGQYLQARTGGPEHADTALADSGWPDELLQIADNGSIELYNRSGEQRTFLIERTEWMDQALTASDVTTRQAFRDLFSSEVIRRDERISVGSITLVFTDLRGSTQLYEAIGDAPAFGLVMNHFDIIKKHIADAGGTIVKTIGDAVMAAFIRPTGALQAILEAQKDLASPTGDIRPLSLKAGIHTGPCIAINQDGRLDYFGTTVNITARLEGLSTGTDIIVSESSMKDPDVQQWIADAGSGLEIENESAAVKGITGGPVAYARIRRVPAG
jgi:adenylate cyclase